MPIQFVFDLYNSNLSSEVDKFVQLFKTIETVKREANEEPEDQLIQINKKLLRNKLLSDKRQSRIYQLKDTLYDGANIWLIKPNDFNRGRGVMLFNSISEIPAIMREMT